MKEHAESHPIYIVVDSKKIARCKWCGIGESEEWNQTESGLYCSNDCFRAQNADGMIKIFLMWLVAVPIVLLTIGPMRPSTLAIASTLFILMGCPFLYCGVANQSKKKSIPKDSRRTEVFTETALMKALPSEVSCPSCDGNIDLREVTEDMIYTCEYCSATGTIEIVRSTD